MGKADNGGVWGDVLGDTERAKAGGASAQLSCGERPDGGALAAGVPVYKKDGDEDKSGPIQELYGARRADADGKLNRGVRPKTTGFPLVFRGGHFCDPPGFLFWRPCGLQKGGRASL